MIAVRPDHIARGCPICLHQIDLAHEAALAYEALLRAAKFAELGYGALDLARPEMAEPAA
jgi:hypothetical protein